MRGQHSNSTIALLVMAACSLHWTMPASAVPVSYSVSSSDLNISQVDFSFEGLSSQTDSEYGWVGVNNSQLLVNATGGALTSGYLNISTSQGWVVRNMPVDETSGYGGIGTYFDLGSAPGDVTSLQTFTTISNEPLVNYGSVQGTDPFAAVGSTTYNAQGAGGAGGADPSSNPRTANPVLRIDTSGLTFVNDPAKTRIKWQAGHPNIEQAVNQCYPASVANSLKYLENVSGIKTTNHAHVAGERDNSLVGQLDIAMNRPAGKYTGALNMVQGKLNYLDSNNLDDRVVTTHKQAPGITWISGNITSTTGDKALTSTEDTSNQKLIDWIIENVNQNKDVEIRIGWNAGGGHAVQLTGAGTIGGRNYVSYAHDAAQGQAGGTGFLTGGYGFSYVDDNLGLSSFIGGFTGGSISYAVAEMVTPVPPALWLFVSGLIGLIGFAKRKKCLPG